MAPSGLSFAGPQTYTVGAPIAPLNPTVTGSVTSYSVSPALPAGLVLNIASGQISGTPTAITATADYVIRAQNSIGSTTFALSITVNGAGVLRLEPAPGTTVGVGQSLDVFFTFKDRNSDPYARDLDPALVTMTSSEPAVAAVDSSGAVRGLSAGTAVLTASYQSYTGQLSIRVAGNYLSRNVAVPGQGLRRYWLFRPDDTASTGPLPVILAFHGGGGDARHQASVSLLNAFAQQQKILIAYPEGSGAIQTWNVGACCGSAATQNVDDVAFVSAVIDDITSRDNVNSARIYATGFSNGGMLSHRLACQLADRIAGIAAVAGASAQFDFDGNLYYSCNPARPIPVLHIHATNDRNYPYAGGMGSGVSMTNFYPVDATISDWVARNNVTNQPTIEHVTATTSCYRYDSRQDPNRPFAPVTLCKIDPPDIYDAVSGSVYGGGHSWPGGNHSRSRGSDTPVSDFRANDYLWEFFNR
ncbi:MAG: PHB depolymerase family esterase [Steroidobacteraceae bacterium]